MSYTDGSKKYSQTLINDEQNFISFRIESVSPAGNYNGTISYSVNDTGDTLTWSLKDNTSFDKGMVLAKTNASFPSVKCD